MSFFDGPGCPGCGKTICLCWAESGSQWRSSVTDERARRWAKAWKTAARRWHVRAEAAEKRVAKLEAVLRNIAYYPHCNDENCCAAAKARAVLYEKDRGGQG